MLVRRALRPALVPYVVRLWAVVSEAGDTDAAPPAPRELALPTGRMHLALRLAGVPVRVFADAADATGHTVGCAVVGGARSRAFVRDTARPAPSVGVELAPGAALVLLGAPAGELAGRHTSLDELWGADAERARERVAAARGPAERLDALEALLVERVERARRRPHAAVTQVAARLEAACSVATARAEVGLSHRRLVELFRREVGLGPKAWARVRRLQAVLELASRARAAGRLDWAEIAQAAGFSDQPHLCRDFRALCGIAPGAYRPLAPDRPGHVPLAPDGDRRPHRA